MENITIKELIAEVESKFYVFADSGDIDRTSIYTKVLRILRNFGVDVLKKKTEVVKIENGRGKLPDDFKRLYEARYICRDKYDIDFKGVGMTKDYVVREFIENPAWFNTFTGQYEVSCDSKRVIEKITLPDRECKIGFQSKLMELTPGVDPNSIHADCINKRVKSENKISITDQTVKVNFNKGSIYIEYYALPTNEEGAISIPIFTTGYLYDYIENQVKIEIATTLLANNENIQGLGEILRIELQREREYRTQAYNEVKYNGLQGDKWSEMIKGMNRANMAKYGNRRWR